MCGLLGVRAWFPELYVGCPTQIQIIVGFVSRMHYPGDKLPVCAHPSAGSLALVA